jgi:VanZ family protein
MALLTVYGGLLPFHYQPLPPGEALAAFRAIAYSDFHDLEARGDWVITLVQYGVLSFLLTAALCVDRPRWTALLAAWAVVPAGFALCVAVEFAQLYFPPRTVALNDIILGCLGTVAGVVAWTVAGPAAVGWARRLATAAGVAELAARLLPAYLAVVLVVQLMPFDLVTRPGELAVKWEEGKIRLVPFASFEEFFALPKMALSIACFLPLGLLRELARARGRKARGLPLPPVILMPALVEFLQLFVYSRYCDVTDIITGTVGVVAGREIGRALPPQRLAVLAGAANVWLRSAAPLLAAAWFGTVAVLYWWPMNFSADPALFVRDSEDFFAVGFRRVSLVPFVDYYWGSKYNALDQFVQKLVSFVPLGVIAACSLEDLFRPWIELKVVTAAAAVAGLIAVGQYFLPSHVPSLSSVLIQCTGAWVGFRLTRYLLAVLWAESALYGWLPFSSLR